MIKVIRTKDLHYFIHDSKFNTEINVIDLGLNNGSFSNELFYFFKKKINVYGVEANKSVINKNSNFTIDNLLISNNSGIIEKLYIDDEDSGSSSAVFKKNNKNYKEVNTISLYDYFQKYNLHKKKVYILKIDIEGKEFDILNDKMINFLSKNVLQLCVEFHDFLVDDNRYDKNIKLIFRNFRKNNFYKVNFSLNNGSVLFLNKRFFNLNLILKSKIYFYKYYFGIVRLTKRILPV